MDALQYVTSASVTVEGFDGDGVCLSVYDTAATIFTAEPSQSCRVYIQTISDLNRETLVVATLEDWNLRISSQEQNDCLLMI